MMDSSAFMLEHGRKATLFRTTAKNRTELEAHLRIAALLKETNLTHAEQETVFNAADECGLIGTYEFLKGREISYEGLAALICDLYDAAEEE
jgi:hypothetical protein